MDKMLLGSATRYIAQRNAMQTVYWRKTSDVQAKGFLKYNKTCNFGKKDSVPPPNTAKFSEARSRFDTQL
ncbi:uncharacterized protein LOC143916846 [Arctopsyche grandis]|uniref:uncharacterized protein LOC143916846 n=1 Tax=Arctopsyche grandis TaxID=121162 RepID=UPI00406D9934